LPFWLLSNIEAANEKGCVMENYTEIQNQIEHLYQTTAKQLYNFAFYAVGDKRLAEQTAVSAFSDAFKHISDKSDISLFQKHYFRLLYIHGKKVHRKSEYYISRIPADSLTEMLIGLSFEERYVLLLFCWQKYSIHQIAKTTMLPGFIIERRLNAAVSKANHWSD
jgi:DNA-directed RNA polymerase specialized sigma24 family protein